MEDRFLFLSQLEDRDHFLCVSQLEDRFLFLSQVEDRFLCLPPPVKQSVMPNYSAAIDVEFLTPFGCIC